MKIVHISDLHTAGPNFIPEWGEKVIEIVNSIKADVLVVTGDLTDDGYAHEYDIVKKYLDRIKAKSTVIVPGNHDARNEGYMTFEEVFETRFPYYEDESVVILGIDSTEPDIDDGHIGRENYAFMREKLSVDNRIKILTMHHHLIPIPGTGRERNIPVDSGDVLELCNELGLNFVFSGHKHVSWAWQLENTYYITAGTATSRRLKGRSYPSFNIVDIEDKKMSIKEVNVMDATMKEILKIKLTLQ